MVAKRVKLKPGEDLSAGNVKRAIAALDKGETKKAACGILGIAYNTTRLATIIERYHENVAFEKKQRAARRGKAVDTEEAVSMIEQYLAEASMESVAKTHWRGTALVKATLSKHGALLKSPKTDYHNPELLPDECVVDTVKVGQLVWSSRYNGPAEVDAVYPNDVYRIWVLGPQCQFSMQPIEELGSLKHLEDLGVNIKRIIME